MNQTFENGGHSKEFNLRDMAQNFMDGLQRHADMLALNLASRESVQEAAYKRRAAAPQIMPAGKRHQNFEQMRYARDLLLRQAINDCIGHPSPHCATVISFSPSSKNQVALRDSVPRRKRVLKDGTHFLKCPWRKIHLRGRIRNPTRVQRNPLCPKPAMKALVENNGILKAEYLGGGNKVIVLKIKKLTVEKQATADEKGVGRILDEEKVFRAGEAIVLSDVEIQRLLVTIASFADAFFKSVDYRQKLRNNSKKTSPVPPPRAKKPCFISPPSASANLKTQPSPS